ncbi:MAG: zonular occludens toxin domain-containing protein, partial [Clostridia bacterium]
MTVFVVISAIILVIIIVNILLQFFRAVRLPKQSIIAFTGTLGSGKTYLAVKHAIRAYNKQRFHHKIYKALAFLPFRNKLLKDWKYEASFYSNIPVQIDKETISTPLKKEDLLERSRLPQKCVVLIDEIGQLASQWEFDNPLVMEQLGTFIRFFRHWLDGKMFVTDQVADNIVKQIRSRLGMIYNLHDFHRYGGIMPFFKVTAIPLILIEDATNAVESFNGEDYEDTFFFGFLSYSKSGKHKKYQTRCFKPIYTDVALRTIE